MLPISLKATIMELEEFQNNSAKIYNKNILLLNILCLKSKAKNMWRQDKQYCVKVKLVNS